MRLGNEGLGSGHNHTTMAKTRERAPVTGLRIAAPADFCSALGAHSHSLAMWVKPRGERELTLQRALNEMFKELPFVDALDPESVDDFLSGVESPLEILHHLGFQLFVVIARGKDRMPAIIDQTKARIATWRHNSYIVAPSPAFFWIEDEDRPRVLHMLTDACRDGHIALAGHPEARVHVYRSTKQLSGALEGEIPWCPVCFLESMKQITE